MDSNQGNNNNNNTNDTLGHSVKLWGMMYNRGTADSGAIFKVNGDGTEFEIVFSFTNQTGCNPYNTLCRATNGKLYGMTFPGGAFGAGTIFSFNPNSNAFHKLLDFDILTNGIGDPFSDFNLAADGKIYATNGQFIFKIDPIIDTITKVLSYRVPLDTGSLSTMTQIPNGKLYGISRSSSTANGIDGSIFSFNPSTRAFAFHHIFAEPTGMTPTGSLCYASDGNLYGLASNGGANGLGVFFKFNPATNIYTKLVDFDGTNGSTSGLRNHVVQVSSMLYGTIVSSTNEGFLFSWNLITNSYKVEHTFIPELPFFYKPIGILAAKGRNLLYIVGYDGEGAAILRYNLSDNSYTPVVSLSAKTSNGAMMYGDLTE